MGYDRRKEEAYVTDSGNPSPAVITFTTEVATMRVSELINRITAYKLSGSETHLVRFFHQGIDRRPATLQNKECPICADKNYWGQGDIVPFLDITMGSF